MAINEYRDLEVGIGSPAAQALFDQVAEEATTHSLTLTDDGEPMVMSANLTSAMSTWLSSHVAPKRGAAITEIEAAATNIKLPGDVSGMVPEFEDDKLRRDRNSRRSHVKNTFQDAHGPDLEKLKDVEREYLAIRVQEGGREPRNPGKLVDLLIPLGIMIPEAFMNYKFFLEYIGIGIVALGSTIVVGLGIGWSGFITGRFMKAYQHFMAPDNDRQRAEGKRMISIAAILLLVSLLAVGVVRYMGIVRDNFGRIAIGQPPLEPYSQTGMLLFGNLVVFGLGVAITYWLHDRNPLYAEKAEVFKKQENKVEKLRRRELNDKLRQIDDSYKQKSEKMKAQAALMDGQAGYDGVRKNVSYLRTKDEEVTGVLNEYRARLARKLPKDISIQLKNGERVDPANFAALSIHLYRC